MSDEKAYLSRNDGEIVGRSSLCSSWLLHERATKPCVEEVVVCFAPKSKMINVSYPVSHRLVH